jgi:predicted alpha/beta-fold hydrolase
LLYLHRFWNPANRTDAILTLESINNDYQKTEIFLTGYSAGTNGLKNVLLERDVVQKSNIIGVFSLCVVQDYKASVERLENSIKGRFFSYLMTMVLKDIIKKNDHVHMFHDNRLLKDIMKASLLSDYDAIAPRFYGYKSHEEYYNEMSSFNLDHISIPMLVLQPRDDPLHLVRTSTSYQLS